MAFVLSLAMVVSLCPAFSILAFADDDATSDDVTVNRVVSASTDASEEGVSGSDASEEGADEGEASIEKDTKDVSLSASAGQQAIAKNSASTAKAFVGVNTGSMDNPSTNAYNADEDGVGSKDNPYRILVGEGASCRPSAFWSNGENAAGGGGQTIPDMRIIFENREGNAQDGTLLYSYDMDTAECDESHLEPSWTYAFRLSPYVESDTSTGVLRFATASKGSFDFYFPTFEFKVNAQYLTKDLSEEHQLKPGDTACVTYYGAYDNGQTSRGTNYTINFDTTDSNTTYQEEFIVDEGGFITIDPLPTGGNYTVDKVARQDDPVIYKQSNGYEPYTGWQGSAYRDTDDPLGASGGGGTNRKGYPSWSLVTPLSIGVSAFDGSATTGSEVTVVTDMNETDLSGAGTYSDPWYYKNIILPSMDASDGTIEFTFNYLGAGGLNISNLYDGNGGVIVSTSADPADWSDAENVAVTLDAAHTAVANTDDNWRKNVTFSVDATNLEEGQTYYFVIKNGTKSGHARSWADFVFEFSTDSNRSASWEGNLSSVAYVGDQGDGAKLGFYLPERSTITTDLNVLSSCWDNTATEPIALEDGVVTVRAHCDGGGSNWQTTSSFASAASGNVHVYTSDPVASGTFSVDGLTEAGSITYTQVGDEDLPTYAGVDVGISDLESGKTYWLVFDASFQPNTNKGIMKPIVLQFQVAGEQAVATSWDVSAAQDNSVIAQLVPNDASSRAATTYTLQFTGAGTMKGFSSATDAPWYADYGDVITRATIADGITNVGAYALGLPKLEAVFGGSTLSTIADHAFDGAAQLAGIDLTGCTLTSVGANSFGSSADGIDVERTIYVKNAASVTAVKQGFTSEATSKNAVVNCYDGFFADDAVFENGKLSDALQKDGCKLVDFYTDETFNHSWTQGGWKPMSADVVFYAKFVDKGPGISDVGSDYAGWQGEAQQIRVLDLSKLPKEQVNNPDVRSYGEDEDHYLNKFQTPFDGNEDIVFAYVANQGMNANGGTGEYQKQMQLPYISILNSEGETVATWDQGAGKLKLFSTVFNGQDGLTQGDWIDAFRIGVEAGTLEPGTYTLRFGAGLGSNNGTSFLGKDVDFEFEVKADPLYELQYTDVSGGKSVHSVKVYSDDLVDVVIPASVNGAPVVGIDLNAFKSQDKITSITVPATVKSIGANAFADMQGLSWVKVLSTSNVSPTIANNVFAFTQPNPITLYGYGSATTVQECADGYSNVTFRAIDEGVYVNGALVEDGDTVELSKDAPDATVQMFDADGNDVTDDYIGYLSNTNIVTHEAPLSGYWQQLTAVSDGEVSLVIREPKTGDDFATVKLASSGFGQEGSTDLVDVTAPQGNGCTVLMRNATVKNAAWDETIAYDNYIEGGIGVDNATFTMVIDGPGSQWGTSRWDWDTWTEEHLNPHLNVYEKDESKSGALGKQVASFEDGNLYWITNSSSTTVTLGVKTGVLEPGKTYVLVASPEMTGHNVNAKLLAEVHWTFEAVPTDLTAAKATIANIDDQTYTGEVIEPAATVSIPTPAITLWDESTESEVVKQKAGTRTLTTGTDYTLSYKNNTDVSEETDARAATVTATGTGRYTGTVSATFQIVPEQLDFTAFDKAIADADDLLANTATSADGKDVPDGTEYAPAEAKTAFADAIAAAKTARDTVKTSEQLKAAEKALADAQTEFEAQVKTATVDRDALEGAIADAKATLEGVEASADGSDVAPGVKWATPASIKALQGVIDAASKTLDDEDATQNAIDKAASDVAAAAKTFEDNIGTANPTVINLRQAISDAAETLASVDVATQDDANDMTDGSTWVAQADHDALQKAIDTASALADNPGQATQDDIDAAQATLEKAVKTFEAAVKTVKADTAALEGTYEAGLVDLDSVLVSDDGSNVYTTEWWVTQHEHDALVSALADAQAALDDPAKTANSVKAAQETLAQAIDAFDAAKKAGFKPDPRDLEQAVADAQDKLDGMLVDESADQVAKGKQFVTQEAHDAFAAAIAKAQAVLDNPDATQAEIDAAMQELSAASEAFNASVQTGTWVVSEDKPKPEGEDGGKGAGAQTGDSALAVALGGSAAVALAAAGILALIRRKRTER